ncbi:MAG: hypothetical protein IJO46_05970 [Thermoguttaceae bacterium]|nr:hypothetical protein [Thermoguttaceae bacterium]
MARMVSVNQFNPNFRYCHFNLTDKKSLRRADLHLSKRAPNQGGPTRSFSRILQAAVELGLLDATVDEQK